MASPLHPAKSAVDLAAPVLRVSRIRRDPPPKIKTVSAAEVKEREGWSIAVGSVAVALALIAILIGVTSAAGWSPREYTVRMH